MLIVFEKLRWKNLLSTGNVFTELNLNTDKTTLIVGKNGAGKSSILDSLLFVLFGKAFRKINKPQLLNSITQKNLVVEVEFSISNQKYKIIRGMKPNIFEVYLNGNLLNQSAEVKDYQEILEKQILKVNYKSFCQVVVLGSATFQPFMQLPTGQRREIIEDLLDLQIFTTMNSVLKNKILTNSEKIYQSQSNKKLIEEKIKLIKEHLIDLQNNNEQLVVEKKERIKETNAQLEKLSQVYWEYENKRKELEENLADSGCISKKLEKLSKLKHQIEANLSLVKKDVDFFNKHDNCPTCKQEIDEQFKCETIESKGKQISEYEEGLELLTRQYEEKNIELKNILEIKSKINDIKMEINTTKSKINSMIEYRDRIEEEIKSIKKVEAKKEDNKIPELEKELTKINSEYNELIEEKNIFNVASTLLKDGGIKSRIVKQYVPVINKLINKYLSSMEFMCQFELDEQFNETLKSRHRDEFSYASFSEGEKMRINLAILFTWRALAKLRNSINTNLLIMDEVFDSSLDSNGTEEFLKIIKDLTSDTNTFIISHKTDQLYDKFDRVIRFEKHKSFSRISDAASG
jgi:DNA repair exonuclease SbcCD ATPase subunit